MALQCVHLCVCVCVCVCVQVHEPEKCPSCNKKYTLALVHNLCTFLNKQMVKMQVRC